MKIKDIIDQFIAGDWGEETCSNEMPCAVTCVRGADIIPISEYNFSAIPIRYITQQSYLKNRLQVGNIIIEKSGGSPTQSTLYHKNYLIVLARLFVLIFVPLLE